MVGIERGGLRGEKEGTGAKGRLEMPFLFRSQECAHHCKEEAEEAFKANN